MLNHLLAHYDVEAMGDRLPFNGVGTDEVDVWVAFRGPFHGFWREIDADRRAYCAQYAAKPSGAAAKVADSGIFQTQVADASEYKNAALKAVEIDVLKCCPTLIIIVRLIDEWFHAAPQSQFASIGAHHGVPSQVM
jgi:hypothetical protein